jgi:hypothetical protein
MHNVWTQITPTPLFGITLTVLSYAIGLAIQRACRGAAVFNPVLISILLIAGVLKATGTSYQTYLALVMSRSLKSKPATFWNRKQLHGTVRMRDQRSMSNCLKVMAQN